MSKMEQENHMSDHEESGDLKGTLFGVGVVGIVILLSWFGVWSLFLSR